MVSSEKESSMSDNQRNNLGSTARGQTGGGVTTDGGGWPGLDDRSLIWWPKVREPGHERHYGLLRAVLLVGFAVLSWAVVTTGRVGTGESADMVNYHVPVIRTFAQELPTPDLAKYDSATTPGYHLALALVWKMTGMDHQWPQSPRAPVGAGPSTEWPEVNLTNDERSTWTSFIHALAPMQLLNIVFSAGLVATVFAFAARFVPVLVALALTLPLALNQ